MQPEQLPAIAAEATADELPALIGALEAAKAVAWARLAATAQARGPRPVEASAPAATDRLLTMPEVAEQLGITEHQAREMGRRGKLPTVRVGERRVRVRASALAEWVRVREFGGTLSPRRP